MTLQIQKWYKQQVEGTKTWKDGNAKNRPNMIKVDLLQNG
ncbi:Cna B-type domain-containing protein, partial [Bacillus mycoides]